MANYTIEEHKHIFAAWAAGRAASVINYRFKVEQGQRILEASGIRALGLSVDNLPAPDEFDKKHREWRCEIIKVASKSNLIFSHGVAAKLINIYLKSIYVCGGMHNDPKVQAIHPPIDRILLDALYKQNVGGRRDAWQEARKARWSKFTSEEYENVIATIKAVCLTKNGLWEIEESWIGYQ